MERDPRVDPQFGDELLCQESEAMVRFGYGQPFLARVVAMRECQGQALIGNCGAVFILVDELL